jgi:di/tricarboxylate transporter
MSDTAIAFAILGLIVVLFVSGRVPVVLVALFCPIALWATGLLDLDQALAGFGDQTVIFIATLFVVSEGLDASGVTAWAGQLLLDRAGNGRVRLVVLTMLLVAAVTALISVNGAVAALLPVVVVLAVRTGRPPSQLLIPLVFGAHAGSMLALTGTPVNVIVSNAAVSAGAAPFGYFEFALAGVPLLAAGILAVVVLGPRLLPERQPERMPVDLSQHGTVLRAYYGVPKASEPDEAQPPTHLDIAAGILRNESGLVEIVIPPRSPLVGHVVFPGMVTSTGDSVVLAIRRRNEELEGPHIALEVGDSLLLEGSWTALRQHAADPRLLVVDSPDLIRRQAVQLGPGSGPALLILGFMILALVTGIVPAVMAGLIAAVAMVLFRVLSVDEAFRGINWTTVILVAGMIPLSTALVESGAANQIADALVNLVGGLGPVALLAGLFVVTAVFGQLISNMATALIVIPIALAAATDLGVSVRPVLMSLTIAASAAYLTPIATPVNMMVMGPGGYRFGDYWRLGLPMLLITFVVAVFLVPVIWPF